MAYSVRAYTRYISEYHTMPNCKKMLFFCTKRYSTSMQGDSFRIILAKPSEAAAAAESVSIAVRKRNTPLDSPACCARREAYRLKTKRKALLIQ